jgi:hypothetical protein
MDGWNPCGDATPRADCRSFRCRAAAWSGPGGLTPADLRYSVVLSMARPWRVGQRRTQPYELEGVRWRFVRREREPDEGECRTAHVYDAVMGFEAFADLMDHFTEDEGYSGGILGPAGAPTWWAPSCIWLAGSGHDDQVVVTAWPASRDPAGEDLYDEWDSIGPLLAGGPVPALMEDTP